MPRGGSDLNPAWSETDDQILEVVYRSGDESAYRRLPELLKRSKSGIHCRAGELGLSWRSRPKPPAPPPKLRDLDLESERRSKAMKELHASRPHPMAGKPVPQEVRDKISKANKGRKVPSERTDRSLKTRLRKYGTLAIPRFKATWKSGWREVGGRRFFARSRWEANYARYLETLKLAGIISEWEHEVETFWFEKIKRGVRSYLPDFRVTKPDGTIEYHEVKGWMCPRSKTKLKRMAKYHPNIKITLIQEKWFKTEGKRLSTEIDGWET